MVRKFKKAFNGRPLPSEAWRLDMEVEAAGPAFSEDLLRLYYARLFPYEQFCEWLAYEPADAGARSKLERSSAASSSAAALENETSTLARREFSFTLDGDVYIRYQCFADATQMKAAMTKRQPVKIDIGAVFNTIPSDHLSTPNFRPEERELVFDIDLSDYDDVRTCCKGATVCKKCWKFMTAAIRVVDATLRDDFGFEHIMWVYSGRRGVHCWVGDRAARALTNEARSAVVAYFAVVHGSENNAQKLALTWPLHPALQRAYDILEPIFAEHIVGEHGQRLLADPALWASVLKTLPEDIGAKVGAHWDRSDKSSTPRQKWEALKSLSDTPAAAGGTGTAKKQKRANGVNELWKYETVFTYCYPRLDENVSKQRNHLLKSPFAAHPKTGRICLPLDASKCDDFDPTTVPTLRDLAAQIDAHTATDAHTPDLDKTELKASVMLFKRSFVDPIRKSLAKERRARTERQNAHNADF